MNPGMVSTANALPNTSYLGAGIIPTIEMFAYLTWPVLLVGGILLIAMVNS